MEQPIAILSQLGDQKDITMLREENRPVRLERDAREESAEFPGLGY